ncbi:MAG: hypothetical protein CMH31_04390 [Micavibrio sp.]|nr:hypothetical protein [Micavibrio sp.]|tara:strand:- start:112 stop:444 length:333 start_codon:yes stop_codon:yes gene_type:complete
MEFIITLIVLGIIYKKIKKAAGVQKKLSDFNTEDFKKLQTQGTTDLQQLLNKVENLTKKSAHIHSDSNYNNKNYVSKKDSSLKAIGEPTVKRSIMDQRGSEETVSRKNYD